MAGLNINSRQKSIHGSNKKNNGSLLLVIFFGFTSFRCFYWLFSSSTVRYTKLFHSNCPRCFPLFHEKTHLRQEPMYENLRHSFLVIISQYVQK